MKKLLLVLCFTLAGVLPLASDEPLRLTSGTLKDVVCSLSLEEKVLLLVGGEMDIPQGMSADGMKGRTVAGACGYTHAIPRLGIPSMVMADGPAGVRIDPRRENDSQTYYGTAFPIATALASSWNTDLVRQFGRALGEEAREYGIDLVMGPALNIQRNPLCGRNFEYYSEDPLLSGKMAAAAVSGIQAEGVGATVKHFAVNNQETNRVANQANLSRRALYEIYLRGFEIAVREARPWAVMTSYNYINGTYASENAELLEQVLRGRWGFQGLVMTDWFGGSDPVSQMKAGNDLLMPGRLPQYEAILSAAKKGVLPISTLNRNVEHLLESILRSQSFHSYRFSDKPDLIAHAEVARNAALESIVLLKNEGNVLPLSRKSTVAFFGNTSYDSISGGTGSGDVHEPYTVSIREGAENQKLKPMAPLADAYTTYLAEAGSQHTEDRESNPLYDFLAHPRNPEMVVESSLLARAVRKSDAAVVTLGRNAGEHADRVIPDDFNLSAEELELLRTVTEAFHKVHKPVIVVLNTGGVVETASWSGLSDAILVAWHGGQEIGNAVGAVLAGTENPSGHLPMTFPLAYDDLPGAAHFPSDHGANVEEILRNVLDVRGKRYERKNIDYTDYVEDLYVGYRYFTTWGHPTAYPFGFGLSYTSFSYDNASIETTGDGTRIVTLQVTNTGNRPGKDVVQLYVTRPLEDRPVRELVSFRKTRVLKPGESEHLAFRLSEEDLSCCDREGRSRILPEGGYTLTLARHSEDVGITLQTRVEKGKTLETYPDILRPQKRITYYNFQ